MRAVNLIPAEERRSNAAGRSGGAVYALLGALALLVVLAGAYAMIGRSIDNKRSEVARVKAEADAAEAKSADLKAYTDFAGLRKQRTDSIMQLAESRFDWARVLHEVARTIPDDAWLSDLHGTAPAATGAAPAGASTTPTTSNYGASAAPATTATGPTIELTGCTSGQRAVARLMVELRRIDGVDKVNLTSSTKAGATGGSTGSATAPAPTTASGAGAPACTGSQFALTLQFHAPGAASSTGAAPATTATTPATAGSTP
jgi:Tfp pilus assembly protein PilN